MKKKPFLKVQPAGRTPGEDDEKFQDKEIRVTDTTLCVLPGVAKAISHDHMFMSVKVVSHICFFEGLSISLFLINHQIQEVIYPQSNWNPKAGTDQGGGAARRTGADLALRAPDLSVRWGNFSLHLGINHSIILSH